jgi:hypothetical protein
MSRDDRYRRSPRRESRGYDSRRDDRDRRDYRDPRDSRDSRGRDPRDLRDMRDPRDSRDLRDPRDDRGRDPRDLRNSRDFRDSRDRDMRDSRDHLSEYRDPRDEVRLVAAPRGDPRDDRRMRRSRSRGRGDDRGHDRRRPIPNEGGYGEDRRHASEYHDPRDAPRDSRGSPRDSFKPRSGVDQSAIEAVRAAAMNPNISNRGPSAAEMQKKKQACQVWIGNLLQGTITADMLREFLKKMFMAIPEFEERYKGLYDADSGPIKEVKMTEGNSFAFVEFHSEELAVTCREFNGADFMGRPLKTGTPSHAQNIDLENITPLDVTPLREAGLLPSQHIEQNSNRPQQGTEKSKAFELYFGNLPKGQLDVEGMKALVRPASQMLPAYDASLGDPVTSAYMNADGTFCFIQFQSEALATQAMPIFDQMDLMGRVVKVKRPTGYQGPEAATPVMPDMNQTAQMMQQMAMLQSMMAVTQQ